MISTPETARCARAFAGPRMNTFGDTWRYLTDGGNWTGEGGLLA